MKPKLRWLGVVAAVALVLMPVFSVPVWPGGSGDEGPDDHQDNGPSYFGFVKDASGKIVADAKVTAEIKGRGSVVTRSDKVGTYKLPGFGKEIDPKNVLISCSKDGYRQLRTFRRTQPGKAAVAVVETECTLERVSK
jgi:hypothetical protein